MFSLFNSNKFRYPFLCFLALLLAWSFTGYWHTRQANLDGAYADNANSDTSFLITIADDYFSYSAFSKNLKRFYFTWGGPIQKQEHGFTIPVEYHSMDKEAVGQMLPVQLELKAGGLDFFDRHFRKVNAAPSDLVGCWRIAGRMQNGEMREMPLAARRTLKLLTDNRFQWMAINIETGEFSGTGGGTYTLKNGVYTETIEFFSRDSTRVGQSLAFEGKVEDGKWFHSGKSSRGEPISEVWVHLTGH